MYFEEREQLHCRDCVYKALDKCKNINHTTVKLLPPVFNVYESARDNCLPCKYFKPHTGSVVAYMEWQGFDDYYRWWAESKETRYEPFISFIINNDRSVAYRVPYFLFASGEYIKDGILLATERYYQGKRDRVYGGRPIIYEKISGVRISDGEINYAEYFR